MSLKIQQMKKQTFGLHIISYRPTKNIPDLFNTNGVLVISDGVQARMGSLTATGERFMRWRTINGETIDPLGENWDLETLVRGFLIKRLFKLCSLFYIF